jgi:hypothetical protein
LYVSTNLINTLQIKMDEKLGIQIGIPLDSAEIIVVNRADWIHHKSYVKKVI